MYSRLGAWRWRDRGSRAFGNPAAQAACAPSVDLDGLELRRSEYRYKSKQAWHLRQLWQLEQQSSVLSSRPFALSRMVNSGQGQRKGHWKNKSSSHDQDRPRLAEYRPKDARVARAANQTGRSSLRPFLAIVVCARSWYLGAIPDNLPEWLLHLHFSLFCLPLLLTILASLRHHLQLPIHQLLCLELVGVPRPLARELLASFSDSSWLVSERPRLPPSSSGYQTTILLSSSSLFVFLSIITFFLLFFLQSRLEPIVYCLPASCKQRTPNHDLSATSPRPSSTCDPAL
ncbi:hypothetical protein J3F83DRAFT_11137 [Trichoderma novae-zelandiae]